MNASDFLDRLFDELAELSDDPFGSQQGVWIDAIAAAFGREAVPALIHQAARDRPFRMVAIRTLGRIGDEAAEAAPFLVELLEEMDEDFYQVPPDPSSLAACAAEEAICEMKPVAVLGKLVRILTDGPDHARVAAANVCGAIGAEAREALPALKRLLATATPETEEGFRQAIANIECGSCGAP